MSDCKHCGHLEAEEPRTGPTCGSVMIWSKSSVRRAVGRIQATAGAETGTVGLAMFSWRAAMAPRCRAVDPMGGKMPRQEYSEFRDCRGEIDATGGI